MKIQNVFKGLAAVAMISGVAFGVCHYAGEQSRPTAAVARAHAEDWLRAERARNAPVAPAAPTTPKSDPFADPGGFRSVPVVRR